METYDFSYGTQYAEFERPNVPEIVAKKGIAANVTGKKYNLKLNPSESKAVIKCLQSSKTTLSQT